jgi:hypothetical protein
MDCSDWRTIVGISSGVILCGANVRYFIAVIKGTTRPNRATWIMLATVSLIIAASYRDLGAGPTLYAAIGASVGTIAVGVLAIWYGVGGNSNFDRICILTAGLSLLIYFLSSNSLVTLIASLTIDAAAIIPTIKHSIETPYEEDLLAWNLTLLGDVLAVIAINAWTIDIALYPIYMVAMNGLIVLFLYRPLFRETP